MHVSSKGAAPRTAKAAGSITIRFCSQLQYNKLHPLAVSWSVMQSADCSLHRELPRKNKILFPASSRDSSAVRTPDS